MPSVCDNVGRGQTGADWPSGVQGPLGRSVLGPLRPFGALKMHQNALKCIKGLYKCTKMPKKIAYVTNHMTGQHAIHHIGDF